MELKVCNFLSTLFWKKDFISQESPILADVEKKKKIMEVIFSFKEA